MREGGTAAQSRGQRTALIASFATSTGFTAMRSRRTPASAPQACAITILYLQSLMQRATNACGHTIAPTKPAQQTPPGQRDCRVHTRCYIRALSAQLHYLTSTSACAHTAHSRHHQNRRQTQTASNSTTARHFSPCTTLLNATQTSDRP